MRESLSAEKAIEYTRTGDLLRLTDYDPRTQEDWFGKNTPYDTPLPASGKIRIHRAVPPDIKDINYGDYVTQSREYAKSHLESVLLPRVAPEEKRKQLETLIIRWNEERYKRGKISKALYEGNIAALPELGIGSLREFAFRAERQLKEWEFPPVSPKILEKDVALEELSPVNPNEFFYIPSKRYVSGLNLCLAKCEDKPGLERHECVEECKRGKYG